MTLNTPLQRAIHASGLGAILEAPELAGMHTAARARLEAVRTLDAYRRLLATARERKSKLTAPSLAFEASVLREARRARHASRRVAGDTLLEIQQLRQSAFFPELLGALGTAGKVDLASELSALASNDDLGRAFEQQGISKGLLQEAAEGAKRLQLTMRRASDSNMTVEGKDINAELVLDDVQGTGKSLPKKPADLLRFGVFDAVVDGFVSGDLPFAGSALDDPRFRSKIKKLPLFDAYAVGSLAMLSEVERHVRKLECSGVLDTHRGGAPAAVGVILLVIALVAMAAVIVGSSLILACELSGSPDLCTAGGIVAGIGFILLAAAIAGVLLPIDVGLGVIFSVPFLGTGISILSTI